MGASDLPLPAGFAAALAGAIVVVAFLVLSARSTTPRLQHPSPRVTPRRWAPGLVAVLGAAGLLGWAAVLVTGFADGTGSALNLAPLLVGVVFWVAVPTGSILLGDWWRHLSPWRRLSRRLNAGIPERPDVAGRWGVWPATMPVLGLAWLLLVSPDGADPRTLAWAAFGYTALVVAAGRLLGPETGLRVIDGFHTGYQAFGAVAAVDLDRNGVARPGWLRRLAQLPEWPGFPALILTWAGAVLYDGLAAGAGWSGTFGSLARQVWFGTVSLVVVVAVAVAAYHGVAATAARSAGPPHQRASVARRFGHTLVPLALGMVVSRYLGVLLLRSQLLVTTASDPAGRGWDLVGTAGWVPAALLGPQVLWTLQVAVVIAGGIAGVALAYDRALADFGPRLAVRSQYGMLALMVALTSLAVAGL